MCANQKGRLRETQVIILICFILHILYPTLLMRVESTLGERRKGVLVASFSRLNMRKKMMCELQIRSWHQRTSILSCDILNVIPLEFGL